jgi:hypothetical protein
MIKAITIAASVATILASAYSILSYYSPQNMQMQPHKSIQIQQKTTPNNMTIIQNSNGGVNSIINGTGNHVNAR